MALLGSLATIRAQTARMGLFGPAFAYLDDVFRAGSPASSRLHSVAVGETKRVDLEGGAFALEQAYMSKARSEGFFESHRKYIDVQVVVEGNEIMEVAEISRLTVRQPYDAERDLIKYADCLDASVLRFRAGEAAVFFPVDGHFPSLRAGAAGTLVRKTVVKVPVGPA